MDESADGEDAQGDHLTEDQFGWSAGATTATATASTVVHPMSRPRPVDQIATRTHRPPKAPAALPILNLPAPRQSIPCRSP